MGTVVEVLEKEGSWVKIKSPEPYTAWVTASGLVEMSDKEIRDYLEAPKYICTADLTHVYEKPSRKSPIVSELVLGDLLRIMYKTVIHTRGSLKGYEEGRAVLTKKFVGVVLPSGKTGYVPADDVDLFYKWAKGWCSKLSDPDTFRKDLVSTSLRFLGVPYLWGGTSVKNVDCSGLTRSVYFACGLLLPRNASRQALVGSSVNIFTSSGKVDWSGLLPGDLVFWGREATPDAPAKATHVGMYLGEGLFIHSSGTVRVSSLDPSGTEYYDRKPLCARRIVGLPAQDLISSGVVTIFESPYYFPPRH